MFLGQFHTKLSNKSRTAIPAKLRRELGGRAIISRWYEKSLAVWSSKAWEKLLNTALDETLLTRPARDTERFLLGGAQEFELDAQGRVVIPENLVEYAELGDEIVFIGIRDRIEIWAKKNWAEHETRISANAAGLIEELQSKRGIRGE